MRDFLVEIHTEELPPKALLRLANSFLEEIKARLLEAELTFESAQFFATPRRLAVIVKKLSEKQPDTNVERRGPALSAAYDPEGKPTPACLGFAKSCGIPPEKLIKIKNAQGEWVGYQQHVKGKTAQALLPAIVQQSIASLPIPKRMRWGDSDIEFVRPVHSVIMLYGDKVVPATILGLNTNRKTHGHRFHSKGWVNISSPAAYVETLKNQLVLVDFTERKERIRLEAEEIVKKTLGKNAQVVIQDDLLDEVAGLVEWPVALCGEFDKSFLSVPSEALISAMQDHQRYFPIVDQNNQLLPHFVAISNIKNKASQHVIHGNERVLRARLSDAKFFFDTDLKQKLADRVELLKGIVFQQKLGSLYDKTQRVSHLAFEIAETLQVSSVKTKRAALLAKTDLTSQLVGEFPELQGTAGYHYALAEDLPEEIAKALFEQYLPRFSGDRLPETSIGCILAIADRLDTLVGVFGINQAPTGDKDPFGLRRAALGVLRILIEKQLNLDLFDLLQKTHAGYKNSLENPQVVQQVFQFMLERLKPWYQEQNISTDVLASVTALNIKRPYDLHLRIQAVQAFKKLPEAAALSVANKRVSNILAKYEDKIAAPAINTALFEHDAEHLLAERLTAEKEHIISLSQLGKYTEVLSILASLREPVDLYFEKVLVMSEDKNLRENRLLLLIQLRELFLHVADIALLQ